MLRLFRVMLLAFATLGLFAGITAGTQALVSPWEADVNRNGTVNAIDLMLVAQNFGKPVPTPSPTPLATGGGRSYVLAHGVTVPPGVATVIGTPDPTICPRYVLYFRIVSQSSQYLRIRADGGDLSGWLQVDPPYATLLVRNDTSPGGTSVIVNPARWTAPEAIAVEPNALPVLVDADVVCEPD